MRPEGGSLARVFPEAGELGREQRRARAPAPTLYSLVGCCCLGDWSFGGEAWELGEAASRCSAHRDSRTKAGEPSFCDRAHFSHLRVALALGLWIWPPGAGTFL